MSKFDVWRWTVAAYLAAIPFTVAYYIYVGISSLGDNCTYGVTSCDSETVMLIHSIPIFFAYVTVSFMYKFLKKTKAKRGYAIAFDTIYMTASIYLGYFLGQFISDNYELSESADQQLFYLVVLIAISISAALSTYINWKVYESNMEEYWRKQAKKAK